MNQAKSHYKLWLSSILLVTSNLMPIFAFYIWKQPFINLLIIYWFDLIIIVIFTVLKMLIAKGSFDKSLEAPDPIEEMKKQQFEMGFEDKQRAVKIFRFLIKSSVVLFIIFVLIISSVNDYGELVFNWTASNVTDVLKMHPFLLLIFLASHTVSFFQNFLAKKEYVIFSPEYYDLIIWRRIYIIGGILTVIFGFYWVSIKAFSIMYLLGKTYADLDGHIEEHLGQNILCYMSNFKKTGDPKKDFWGYLSLIVPIINFMVCVAFGSVPYLFDSQILVYPFIIFNLSLICFSLCAGIVGFNHSQAKYSSFLGLILNFGVMLIWLWAVLPD